MKRQDLNSKKNGVKQIWKKKLTYPVKDELKVDYLRELPTELIFQILSLMKSKDLALISLVCKYYNQICEEHWKMMFEKQNWRLYFLSDGLSWKLRFHYGEICQLNWVKRSVKRTHHVFSKNEHFYLPKVQINSENMFCSFGTSIHFWNWSSQNNSHFKRLSSYRMTRSPHTEDMLDFKILPSQDKSSKLVLSASVDKTVRLWNLEVGKSISTLKGHQLPVHSLAINNNVILSGSKDGTVKLWNYKEVLEKQGNIKSMSTIDVKDRVWCVRCDDKRMVVGLSNVKCKEPLKVIDLEKLTAQPLNGHIGPVYDIYYKGVDSHMITASYDGSMKFWDLRIKSPCVMTLDDLNNYPLYSVQYDNNWKLVSGASYHSTARIWDIRRTSKYLQTFYLDPTRHSHGVVYSLDFDDSSLFVALSNSVQQVDFV